MLPSAPTAAETLKQLETETLTLLVEQNEGTYKIEGWESLLPALPQSTARFARSITQGELNALLMSFKSSTWTASLVAKMLEIYSIAKREAEHKEMLKVKHTSQRGGSMTQSQEEDPGVAPTMVCSDCSAPWGSLSKCLLCRGTSPVDLNSSPLSVIEVEGQTWQLRLSDAGPTWVVDEAKASKDSGYVDVGTWGILLQRQPQRACGDLWDRRDLPEGGPSPGPK